MVDGNLEKPRLMGEAGCVGFLLLGRELVTPQLWTGNRERLVTG